MEAPADEIAAGAWNAGGVGRCIGYFTAVAIAVNVVVRLEPTVVTAVMITTEMSAAMRPYSIAVAPLSSRRNAKSLFMDNS
jgi:hypothetical protein